MFFSIQLLRECRFLDEENYSLHRGQALCQIWLREIESSKNNGIVKNNWVNLTETGPTGLAELFIGNQTSHTRCGFIHTSNFFSTRRLITDCLIFRVIQRLWYSFFNMFFSQNGTYACASRCPNEKISPRGSCYSPRLIYFPGHCCRQWLCDSPLGMLAINKFVLKFEACIC